MGRHSSSGQAPFYRSLVGWFLPWVLIAAVAGAAVWVAVDALGQDEINASLPPANDNDNDNGVDVPSPPAETQKETAEPEDTPKPKESKTAKPEDPTAEPELITDGVSVQVLNATSVPDADDRMADRLASLGYSVVAIDSASTHYPATTVFWSTDSDEAAATALAEHFGWIAEPKPKNLSATVDIHVVVGADEA